MNRIAYGVFSLLVVFACVHECRSEVTIEIRFITTLGRPDFEGPLKGEKVYIVPSSGVPQAQESDSTGRVRFLIKECAFMTVWVGDEPYATQLPQMSGRFDQRTSMFVGAAAANAADASKAVTFLRRVRDGFNGREVPSAFMKSLTNVERNIKDLTEAHDTDSDEERSQKKASREEMEEILRSLKVKKGKLGVLFEQTDDGAIITEVVRGGAAEAAGIRRGNIISSVFGKQLNGGYTLADAIRQSETNVLEVMVIERSPQSSSIGPRTVQLK